MPRHACGAPRAGTNPCLSQRSARSASLPRRVVSKPAVRTHFVVAETWRGTMRPWVMAASGPHLPRPSMLGRTLRAHPHFGPIEERVEPALEPLLVAADSRHQIRRIARVDVAKQRCGLWESPGLDLTARVVHERD